LIGDEAEAEEPVVEPVVVAQVEEAKPSCCEKTDGLIGDEEPAPKPTPYLGTAVMALVGVGLLGLLRLGRKAA
jgi:hypothetical protein